jgi:hypothetical protein
MLAETLIKMTQVDGERRAVSQADGPPVPSTATTNALPGYLTLYIALYLAYGTESAYLPVFLRDHGLSISVASLSNEIGARKA